MDPSYLNSIVLYHIHQILGIKMAIGDGVFGIAKNSVPNGFFSVELRGIEPLSEGTSAQASPITVLL